MTIADIGVDMVGLCVWDPSPPKIAAWCNLYSFLSLALPSPQIDPRLVSL